MDGAAYRKRRGDRVPDKIESSIVLTEDDRPDACERNTQAPKYTIDLSLPPRARYKHAALDFKSQAADLPAIFNELVRDSLPSVSISMVRCLARLTLRRVHGREENEELKGISEAIGIKLWLLVAFNVLLDLFMGCTSGGVRIEHNRPTSRMLHFRTLDWGMDPLRKMIVHLDFVKRPGSEVIASSLGYLGYVGVLTGIRKGLSISLNFRPNHDRNDRLGNFLYYSHIVLVLLGFRPSISSLLRLYLLPSHYSSKTSSPRAQDLDFIAQHSPHLASTAAYLIFSDGDRTLVMEKDNSTANVRAADDFIAVTNHDVAEESGTRSCSTVTSNSTSLQMTGMKEIVEESLSRKSTIVQQWEKSLGKHGRGSSSRLRKRRQILGLENIAEWIDTYPITNEETHFAAIMDPKAGKVVWMRCYAEAGDYEEYT